MFLLNAIIAVENHRPLGKILQSLPVDISRGILKQRGLGLLVLEHRSVIASLFCVN